MAWRRTNTAVTATVADLTFDVGKAFNEYALALGTVVHSSSNFQETLSRLYWHLVGGDLRVSNAVWHSSISDKAQREMLRAALDAKPEHFWEKRLPKARKELGWLITEADKVANQRNNAVHAPCLFSYEAGEVISVPFTLNRRAANLKNKKLIKEYELYADILGKLNTFALMAAVALGNNSEPWPDKPVLPTRDKSYFREPGSR